MTSSYAEKLRDPRWQKKRLEILERDEWMCQNCFDSESTLVVHHRRYLKGTEPWEYPNGLLLTLCVNCHECERVYRQEYESRLLEELKSHFLADDIRELALGFSRLTLVHSHEIVASILEWALSTPEVQIELKDQYFKHTKIIKGHDKDGKKKTDRP